MVIPADKAEIIRTARISACETYRYWLGRRWRPDGDTLMVVMVNPSTADHRIDDPTIQTLMKRADRWGFGGITVLNLFALRSPAPAALKTAADPMGPENATWLSKGFAKVKEQGGWALAAWGNNCMVDGGRMRVHVQTMAMAYEVELRCLGKTADGHPKHPLARGVHRVPDDFVPVPLWKSGLRPSSHQPS